MFGVIVCIVGFLLWGLVFTAGLLKEENDKINRGE